MPKSLADGHIKLAVLTTKPANPAAPTAAELIAGIGGAAGVQCSVLSSDFTFTAAGSDKVQEKALCSTNNANALGASNFTAGLTVFRMFDSDDGTPDLTEDVLYQTLKAKGTTVWVYARETGQPETEAWTAGDELYLGMEVLTDNPQKPQNAGGYIKARIPMEPQRGWPNIAVGT